MMDPENEIKSSNGDVGHMTEERQGPGRFFALSLVAATHDVQKVVEALRGIIDIRLGVFVVVRALALDTFRSKVLKLRDPDDAVEAIRQTGSQASRHIVKLVESSGTSEALKNGVVVLGASDPELLKIRTGFCFCVSSGSFALVQLRGVGRSGENFVFWLYVVALMDVNALTG
jgi:hypothetical protein